MLLKTLLSRVPRLAGIKGAAYESDRLIEGAAAANDGRIEARLRPRGASRGVCSGENGVSESLSPEQAQR